MFTVAVSAVPTEYAVFASTESVTVSDDSTTLSSTGVSVTSTDESPSGIVAIRARARKSSVSVAEPSSENCTVRSPLVLPERVIANVPVSSPDSAALASVAMILTTGRLLARTVNPSSSVIVIVPLGVGNATARSFVPVGSSTGMSKLAVTTMSLRVSALP